MFPLFSLVPLLVLLCWSSELYAAITLLNCLLLAILAAEGTDFLAWFVGFEISLVTGFTALSLESRSFRRLYAFLVMTGCTLISSAGMYALLNSTRDNFHFS